MACVFLCVAYCAGADSKEAILTRMDKAAPEFRGVSANVDMITYTAILGDKTNEKGTLQMQKKSGGEVRAIIAFTGATDSRKIAFSGKLVRIYYPQTNAYQDYDLGKNSGVLNQFLLLGFGSSGKDLEKAYTITAEGQEKVAGTDATKLRLVPRDPKVQEKLSKILIWIPDGGASPVKQQFFEPNDNYRLVEYSNIALNPAGQENLALQLPLGAQRQ